MSYSEKVDLLLKKGILVTPDILKKEFSTRKELSKSEEETPGKIKIVYNYDKPSKKRVVDDFVSLFNIRFKNLEKIIRQRSEMQNLVSINKLNLKNEKEIVSIIGIITKKWQTKNGHTMLFLEDISGSVNVLVNKNNKAVYELAKDLVQDEVIGVCGGVGKNIVFSNEIIFPDIPLSNELKKAPEESYAVFISDIHIGSKVFLKKNFKKFLSWLNGNLGSENQRLIAKKTKYLFLVGDLVEGVGVYPNQEENLDIPDIKEQYKQLANLLKTISSNKKIIICPGNHDSGRIAEPQPPLYNDFAKSLWDLSNTIIISNPSVVNIGSSENFSGLDVLLYHGYSLIYYANNVESIRVQGGQKRVDLLMKFLLQKRHLAPSHESNMYVPDAEEDPLFIDKIPDVFVTGHIHRASASQYRGVTLLNTSCWVDITEDQEKRGLEPQPARAITLNLQTRKVKIINFYG
ncbi:hypothetical protein CMO90_01955 [Candidatus Woesearchaeota archaeon]|jgi:DNA polymerase II small subunit|nr:hypothetical protein [Candidatus Woesearchaeota archaeon]